MIVSFDISAFDGDPGALISVLSTMSSVGQWPFDHNRDVEAIVCKTPSSAFRYCRHVVHAYGISLKGERVFLKNPRIGIRYLRLTNKSRFFEEEMQARFWKKITKSPYLSYEWARSFGKRLSEEEEMVFSENIRIAKEYAVKIIGGPFPEKVHQRILLRSFESMDSYSKAVLAEYIKLAAAHGVGSLEETQG